LGSSTLPPVDVTFGDAELVWAAADGDVLCASDEAVEEPLERAVLTAELTAYAAAPLCIGEADGEWVLVSAVDGSNTTAEAEAVRGDGGTGPGVAAADRCGDGARTRDTLLAGGEVLAPPLPAPALGEAGESSGSCIVRASACGEDFVRGTLGTAEPGLCDGEEAEAAAANSVECSTIDGTAVWRGTGGELRPPPPPPAAAAPRYPPPPPLVLECKWLCPSPLRPPLGLPPPEAAAEAEAEACPPHGSGWAALRAPPRPAPEAEAEEEEEEAEAEAADFDESETVPE
jgi:hypothetical protein